MKKYEYEPGDPRVPFVRPTFKQVVKGVGRRAAHTASLGLLDNIVGWIPGGETQAGMQAELEGYRNQDPTGDKLGEILGSIGVLKGVTGLLKLLPGVAAAPASPLARTMKQVKQEAEAFGQVFPARPKVRFRGR